MTSLFNSSKCSHEGWERFIRTYDENGRISWKCNSCEFCAPSEQSLITNHEGRSRQKTDVINTPSCLPTVYGSPSSSREGRVRQHLEEDLKRKLVDDDRFLTKRQYGYWNQEADYDRYDWKESRESPNRDLFRNLKAGYEERYVPTPSPQEKRHEGRFFSMKDASKSKKKGNRNCRAFRNTDKQESLTIYKKIKPRSQNDLVTKRTVHNTSLSGSKLKVSASITTQKEQVKSDIQAETNSVLSLYKHKEQEIVVRGDNEVKQTVRTDKLTHKQNNRISANTMNSLPQNVVETTLNEASFGSERNLLHSGAGKPPDTGDSRCYVSDFLLPQYSLAEKTLDLFSSPDWRSHDHLTQWGNASNSVGRQCNDSRLRPSPRNSLTPIQVNSESSQSYRTSTAQSESPVAKGDGDKSEDAQLLEEKVTQLTQALEPLKNISRALIALDHHMRQLLPLMKLVAKDLQERPSAREDAQEESEGLLS